MCGKKHPENRPAYAPCPVCGPSIRPGDREKHERSHQVEGYPFVCMVCDGPYHEPNPLQLYQHIRLKHPTVWCTNEIVQCPVCQVEWTARQVAEHACASSFARPSGCLTIVVRVTELDITAVWAHDSSSLRYPLLLHDRLMSSSRICEDLVSG